MPPQADTVWQSMETAPRDGTIVLFVSPAGDYSVGCWDRDEWDMQSGPPRTPWSHWAALPEPPDDVWVLPFAHYCPDWDGLEIDNTMPEWECCCCFDKVVDAPRPASVALPADRGSQRVAMRVAVGWRTLRDL
jgi:hypothetical protein